MSNYAQLTLFTPKDALVTGNPLKLLRGAEFDAEFAAISTAIATKLDSSAAAALGANPTGTIGLAAVNGVASTYIRSDGAPALSQSIAPTWTGLHTFSLAARFADGLVGTPGITFANDLNTGIYRQGADDIRIVAGGSPVFIADATNAYARKALLGADGTASLPGYAFESDPDTGLYHPGANDLRIAVGGIQAFAFGTTFAETALVLGAGDGAVGAPGLYFRSDPDTGFYRISANNLGIVAGGALIAQIDGTNGIFMAAGKLLLAADGAANAPGYTFGNDSDTGFYRPASNQLFFSEGNVGFRIGFRSVPVSTTATTLVAEDVGKGVVISAAINIPASVFAAGDAVSIYNDSAGALNLTISAGTLRLGGTATTGTRSIAARGMCTIWFRTGGATPEVIATGNVT